MKKRSYSYGLVLLMLGTALYSCKQTDEQDRPNIDDVVIRPNVIFAIADGQPLDLYIESRGTVEPIEKFPISLRTSGFLRAHKVVDGEKVQKGDLLIDIDETEAQFNLQEAENAYLKAKNEYEIEIRLRENRGQTNENDEALIRINQGLADAEVKFNRAKLDLTYTKIEAPFSGTVSTKEVITNGSFMSPGQEIGFLINDSKVNVRFEILESEITSLEIGQSVDVFDQTGNTYSGKIVAISPEIDVETKTGKASVEIDNKDGLLKSGMTVEGRIFIQRDEGKARIPRAALLERDSRTLLFKLNGDEVQWIYVTPISMNSEWVLLDHPEVAPGDTIAVDEHFSISHQQKVIPLLSNN